MLIYKSTCNSGSVCFPPVLSSNVLSIADEGVQGKRRRKAIKILRCFVENKSDSKKKIYSSEDRIFLSRRFPWEIKGDVLAQRILSRFIYYRYARRFARVYLMVTVTGIGCLILLEVL